MYFRLQDYSWWWINLGTLLQAEIASWHWLESCGRRLARSIVWWALVALISSMTINYSKPFKRITVAAGEKGEDATSDRSNLQHAQFFRFFFSLLRRSGRSVVTSRSFQLLRHGLVNTILWSWVVIYRLNLMNQLFHGLSLNLDSQVSIKWSEESLLNDAVDLAI